jgi:uncharacterized metal-binding protein
MEDLVIAVDTAVGPPITVTMDLATEVVDTTIIVTDLMIVKTEYLEMKGVLATAVATDVKVLLVLQ